MSGREAVLGDAGPGASSLPTRTVGSCVRSCRLAVHAARTCALRSSAWVRFYVVANTLSDRSSEQRVDGAGGFAPRSLSLFAAVPGERRSDMRAVAASA
jgi:hypothetical protein